MQDIGAILSEEFAVNLYHVLDNYLIQTRIPNVSLDELPNIYEQATRRAFPVPYQMLRNGVMDHILKLSVPATGFTVVESIRLADSSPAAICALHRAKLEQLRRVRQPPPRQAAQAVAGDRDIQLVLRGLHRALRLRPLEMGLPPVQLEEALCLIFFDAWNIPLLFRNLGFESAIALVSAFPGVFTFHPDPPRLPRLESLRDPEFTVGTLRYTPAAAATPAPVQAKMSVEHAKLVDPLRSAVSLIKVELLECANDPEKKQRLSVRLVAKQKQLDDLLAQLKS